MSKPGEFAVPNILEASKAADDLGLDANKSLTLVSSFELAKQGDLEFAVGATAEVKDKLNEVDAKRKQFTEPLRKVVKDIDAFFKPAIDGLKECEKVLKDKISDYNTACMEKRGDLLGKVENEPCEAVRSELIATAEDFIVDKVDGLALRESWKCEIIDAEALVKWAIDNDRLDLVMPNEKALKTYTKSLKRNPSIPGFIAQPSTTVAITVDKVQR